MRKTAVYVGAWFLAGVGAVALASAGVSMVGNQVTGDRPAPLTAAEVREELASDGGATATTPTTATTTPPSTSSTTSTAPSTPVTPPARPSTEVTAAPPVTPTTAPPAPAAPITRTYDLVGGTVTLRFSSAGVDVLVATPAPGFAAKVSDVHDGGARVEFEADDHRSRVDGWWAGGPQDEVREEDR